MALSTWLGKKENVLLVARISWQILALDPLLVTNARKTIASSAIIEDVTTNTMRRWPLADRVSSNTGMP
jgi:hypothetical protein